MKTILKRIAFTFIVGMTAALVACTTPVAGNDTIVQPTPAQIAEQVCPPVQTALSGLNALVGLPAGEKADLDAITPVVAAVCTAGATVNVSNLQALEQTALPAIINAVKASGMEAEQQNVVIVDITAAQLVLTAVNQTQANLDKTTQSTTQ